MDLPRDLDAERIVLGSMLVDTSKIYPVQEILGLDGSAFYDPCHSAAYRCILAAFDRAEPVNSGTVAARLKREDITPPGDLVAWLMDLEFAVIAPESVEVHAKAVREAHSRREFIRACQVGIASAQEVKSDQDAATIISGHMSKLVEIAEHKEKPKTWDQVGDAAFRQIEAARRAYLDPENNPPSRVPTFISEIDDLVMLEPGDLILIGARPAMGKTALACTFMANQCERGIPVGFASAEMTSEQIYRRMLTARSVVPSWRIKKGHLNESELNQLVAEAEPIDLWPYHIDDNISKASQLPNIIRQWKADYDIQVAYVDHLHVIDHDIGDRRASQTDRIGATSNMLKRLAKELRIPIVALSQLSRPYDKSASAKEKRPQLDDLRSCGNLEQDANAVLMLWRESYYDAKEKERKDNAAQENIPWRDRKKVKHLPPPVELVELLVRKNRDGQTGTIYLDFKAEQTKFMSRA